MEWMSLREKATRQSPGCTEDRPLGKPFGSRDRGVMLHRGKEDEGDESHGISIRQTIGEFCSMLTAMAAAVGHHKCRHTWCHQLTQSWQPCSHGIS